MMKTKHLFILPIILFTSCQETAEKEEKIESIQEVEAVAIDSSLIKKLHIPIKLTPLLVILTPCFINKTVIKR